jgi:dihydroneopterin aldolase
MNGSSPPVTAYQYAKFSNSQTEPHSFIRVKNLSTQGLVGGDPWGRDVNRRNIFQPILLSAALSLKEPFSSASTSDTVNASTVNYSSLSKEILKVVASRQPSVKPKDDWSLNDLLEWLSVYLTGKLPGGTRGDRVAASYQLEGGCPCLESDWKYIPPMLNVRDLKELELSVCLPKGSLLCEGISLTKNLSYAEDPSSKTTPHSSVLRIQNMRVPTLIGVNPNERTARQIVVASVEVSPYTCHGRDWYNELEELAFKVPIASLFTSRQPP